MNDQTSKVSAETRAKQSAAKKGGHWSPARRAAHSPKLGKDNPNYGQKRSLETRAKQSAIASHPWSPARRAAFELKKPEGYLENRPCPWCSQMFAPTPQQGDSKRFCSMKCYRAFFVSPEETERRSKLLSARLLDPDSKHRKAIVERMTNRNPGDPVATSKRLKGQPFPVSRGGNGRGDTKPQVRLLKELGVGWLSEHIVFAKGFRGDWPLMRVDIAFPDKKIAVECDGMSHNSPKARLRDTKKDGILRDLGWTVYRFKNRKILAELSFIVDLLKKASV